MNNSNKWSILEKLSAPGTTSGERVKLLKVVESDPELLTQWKAFRLLQQWPDLEQVSSGTTSSDKIVEMIQENESLDNGIKHNFPWVAAAALVASIILVFINIGQKEDASDITLDDVFGLPTPTIENTLLVNL